METFSVNLASGLTNSKYTSSAYSVEDGILTIQVDAANINGDVDIIPLQSNDETDYAPIMDNRNEPIVLRMRNKPAAKKTSSFSEVLNLVDLYAAKVKIQVYSMGADAGVLSFTLKNTEA